MSEPTNGQKKKPKAEAAKLLRAFKETTPADERAKKATPNLLDVLLPIFRDGVCTRQGGRLSVSADGGSWRVSLECPTEGLATIILVDSLATLQDELEAVLASGRARWGLSWDRKKKNLPRIDDLVQ